MCKGRSVIYIRSHVQVLECGYIATQKAHQDHTATDSITQSAPDWERGREGGMISHHTTHCLTGSTVLCSDICTSFSPTLSLEYDNCFWKGAMLTLVSLPSALLLLVPGRTSPQYIREWTTAPMSEVKVGQCFYPTVGLVVGENCKTEDTS